LYECTDQQIPLSREISYLHNYIDLAKLRSRRLEVHEDIRGGTEQPLAIAPFILMTFVENAFKHVSSDGHTHNYIDIDLQVTGRSMSLKIINSTSSTRLKDAVSTGGFGLNNARRRLELIYPGTHTLTIVQKPGTFEVDLQLTLQELTISSTHEMAENENL